MSAIQRILTEEIERINREERRDNRPRFSISFIRHHPGLFLGMYLAYFATHWIMVRSETLTGIAWLITALFILMNLMFFFDVRPRYRYEDIDVLDLRVCFNGEWYNTRSVPESLIARIMADPQIEPAQKRQLAALLARKPQPSFYDIFALEQGRLALDGLSAGHSPAL